MDFLIANEKREDLAYLDANAYLDFDVGDTDDFKLTVKLDRYNPELHKVGNYIYCPNTEYGGILNDPEIDTSNNSISFTGQTFRGILKNRPVFSGITKPYKIVSGELNEVIASLVDNRFGEIFSFDTKSTGVSITDFQISRYRLILDALTDILSSVNYRLKIECVPNDRIFDVQLSAVPIADYSDLVETSQDSGLNFKIKKITNKYTHMICLGQGQLTNRQVKRLHLKDDGSVEEIASFPLGLDVKIYVYDYPNVESEEELLKSGIEKFSEINGTDTQSMTVSDDFDFEIGDIIGGRDYVTGTTIKQPITQKIIKYENETMKISYKLGDDES